MLTDESQHVLSATSYAVGGTTAAAGVMTLNDIALLIGIIATVGTFVVNLIYKHLNYSLAKRGKK